MLWRDRESTTSKETVGNALGALDMQFQGATGQEALVRWVGRWKVGDKA